MIPKALFEIFCAPAQANDFGELAPQVTPPAVSFLYYVSNSTNSVENGSDYSEPSSYIWKRSNPWLER